MYTCSRDMITTDTSAVKPRLPAHKAKLRDRPTPAVNIRVHVDTYEQLKLLTYNTGMSFNDVIRALLSDADDRSVVSDP
jgi:hypothetical protein